MLRRYCFFIHTKNPLSKSRNYAVLNEAKPPYGQFKKKKERNVLENYKAICTTYFIEKVCIAYITSVEYY